MTAPSDPDPSRPPDEGSPPNPRRRKLLVAATGVAGGAGVAGASIPFIASMTPSERAHAAGAPVDAEFSRLEPGGLLTTEWRGRPVWILRRTEAVLKALQDPAHLSKLVDPDSKVASQQPAYAGNAWRSIEPSYLVVVPICTHLGCIPTFRPEVAPPDLGADWHGGLFCPCHGSRFDLAGRVYRNVPAPTNLVVPPHRYLGETKVRIGEDPEGAA
ncbi:MAG: ubiquinol-cytochrome c reductase iron-sulfur subunit [Betaproteobacteria bacterium]|nr:ubiquinol-cytochrome c reductase iron-sulfur subunit [Betaproteobacteria bacterium]